MIGGLFLSRREVPAAFVNLSCSRKLLRICIVELGGGVGVAYGIAYPACLALVSIGSHQSLDT
ncbi:hypothetical protein NA56DRAFT_731808 [Hyaloscypha hepaticicola]|uniref:Uncharacterized protein n=1 Tax=Hyaloscypha hepaticicola TaxID=2082293 RepID=A0A2J6PQ67_9HELO|nr:hypothetical protein NA56DRAFT_731808 [Hyaloscypha hepaticicola]